MPSWKYLPIELKELTANHFLDALLDEAVRLTHEVVEGHSYHWGEEIALDLKVRHMRQQVDNFLEISPEMTLHLLARCRSAGTE